MASDEDALTAARDQGERTLESLLPGDSFSYKGYQTISSMQWRDQRREMLIVKTTPTDDYPGGRTFLLHKFLMFPSFLTDEHFEAEQAKIKDW